MAGVPVADELPATPGTSREQAPFAYDAFISYNHQDREAVAKIHTTLRQIGRRVGHLSALRIFRDTKELSANSDLSGSLCEAMDKSRFFIAMLSPNALDTPWVNREIEYWLSTHPNPDDRHLLFVLLDGHLSFDPSAGCFDPEQSTAAPQALTQPGVLPHEPLYLDLSQTSEVPISLHSATFRDRVTILAAPLHGKSTSELANDDVREQRRYRRVRATLTTVLALLTIFAVVSWMIAVRQRNMADSRALAAQAITALDTKPDLGMLLAIEAWRSANTIEARSAALTALQRSGGVQAILRNPNDNFVEAIAFSPTSTQLAADGGDYSVGLWDLSTHLGQTGWLTVPWGASQLAFSPNGGAFAAIDGQGAAVLWQLSADGPSPLLTLPGQKLGSAEQLTFSPDGSRLAAQPIEGDYALWNVAHAQPLNPLPVPQSPFGTDVISFLDRDTIASFSPESDNHGGVLAAWRIGVKTPLWERSMLTSDWIRSAAFSLDGRTLITLTAQGGLTAWDTLTGRQLASARAPEIDSLKGLVVDPLGARLAAFTFDSTVELFDLPSLTPSRGQPPAVKARSVSFSGDGKNLALGGRGSIILWSVTNETPLETVLFSTPPAAVRGTDMSPMFVSEVFAMSHSDPMQIVAFGHGRLLAWRAPEHDPATIAAPKYIGAVAISRDGSVTAVLGTDQIAKAVVGADQLSTWHPGDHHLSSAWDVGSSTSLALNQDGSLLVSGNPEGDLRLWDVAHRKQWGPPLHTDMGRMRSIAFSPNGNLLAASGNTGVIKIWDVISGADATKHSQINNEIQTFVGHSGPALSLDFDATGSRLVSGGFDGTVRLWDLAQKKPIGGPMATGSYVFSVAFSPDGRTIAAAGEDGLTLWDVATQRMLGPTIATESGLQQIVFAADGRLITMDKSGLAEAWDPIRWSSDRDAISDRLCAIASRNLTTNEWNQYLPGKRYRKTCPQWPAQ